MISHYSIEPCRITCRKTTPDSWFGRGFRTFRCGNDRSSFSRERSDGDCGFGRFNGYKPGDVLIGPGVVANLAVVYAWTNELDLAFATLSSLTKISIVVISYGELKRAPYWEPLRKDSRYEKLLAELKSKDRG